MNKYLAQLFSNEQPYHVGAVVGGVGAIATLYISANPFAAFLVGVSGWFFFLALFAGLVIFLERKRP